MLKCPKNAYNIYRMRFLSEIAKALGSDETVSSRVQYTVLDGKGGYFQNVKKILEFTDCKIVFAGRKDGVAVEGENLTLGKYFAGDAAVLGNIVKVERVSGEKGRT